MSITKTYAVTIVTLGISALLLPPAVAAPKAGSPSGTAVAKARQEIQAIYNREAAAFAAKDVDGFFKETTADAVTYGIDGSKQTVAQGRQMTGRMIAAMKNGDASAVIKSVTLTDAHTAAVTVQQHIHMVFSQPNKPDTDMMNDATVRDTWVKTASGWQMKVSQELSDKPKINGDVVKK